MVKTLRDGATERGEQSCLPVVPVKDGRRRPLRGRPLERGNGQERETRRVVHVVHAVLVVDAGAVVNGGQSTSMTRAPGPIGTSCRSRLEPALGNKPTTCEAELQAPFDAAIPWREDRHVVAETSQRPSERRRDVGEPAGLGERLGFRGDHHDAERVGGAGGLAALEGM